MRNDQSLTNILDEYRQVSIWAAVLIGGVLGLSLLALLMASRHNDGLTLTLAVTGALAGVVLIVLRLGYLSLRWRIEQADAEKRSVLASVHRDALTGVSTRAHFLERLRRNVYHGSPDAVGYLQIDMDNLKVLNDMDGHGAGDAALVQLIETVMEFVPNALIGRLGGDEFGIALIGHDNKQALCRLASGILERLQQSRTIGGRQVRLSATIGVALAPLDATDCDDLISKADLALYKGKKNGRGCVVPFIADMLGDERHRRFVERELRAAILMNELELYYQPVFGADGRTLRSYEALVRWQHKVRGTISPDQFIAIAEQSDMIDKLGDWVLRRACADLAALRTTSLAINVSAAQLRRLDFASRLGAIIREAGVNPRHLIVEITETVPLAAGSVELGNLDALQALGLRIAIDDFGAGHASLQYLREFSFDILKIDRTYVSNIATSNVDFMIVSAICEIARSLRVEVIAEGVENAEQLAILQRAGCTAFQGYLLGRPLPLRQRLEQSPQALAASAA